jgi:hypothetical protein
MAYEYSQEEINAELARRGKLDTSSSYEYSPEEIKAELAKRQGMGRGEAAFTTFTNPLGAGPRIKAAGAAIVAKNAPLIYKGFGGAENESYSDLYNEALKAEQEKLSQAREQYPVQSFATGLAADVGPAGKVLKTAGLGANTFGNAVKGGAALNAVSTLGETQDLTNVPQVAKELTLNTALGAATGGGIQAAGGASKGILDRFLKTPGERLAEKAISPEAAQEGLKILREAPKESPTVGLDINHPEFQNLLGRAVAKYPEAKRIGAEFAAGRKDQALDRIKNIYTKDVSPVDNAFQRVEELSLNRKIAAEPFRVKAYEEGAYIPTKEDIKDTGYLKPNVSKDTKELASKFDELQNDSRIKRYISNSEINAPENSIEMLHNVRKQIDADINGLKNSVTTLGNKGQSAAAANSDLAGLQVLRKKLNNVIYQAAPSMEQHDQIFADSSKLINAVENGRDFNKIPYQDLVKQIKEMPQAEKEAFRIGARQTIQDLAEKATKQTGKSAPAEAIINKNYNRSQIKALFDGDDAKASNFIKKLDEEIRYDQTIKNLGLNKAEVESTNHGLVNMIARVVAGSKTGMAFEGARAAETAMLKQYRGLNKANAKDIIKAFTNKENSERILQHIVNKADDEQKPFVAEAVRNLSPVLAVGLKPEPKGEQ